jgi:predicted nucleotidyltransferase
LCNCFTLVLETSQGKEENKENLEAICGGFRMKTFEEIKEILKKQKPFLMEKYGVTEIGVFGSYVTGKQKAKSDLDILVEFGRSIGFFEFLELEEYLANTLGVKVELVTKGALKPKIGEYILSEVVNI